MYPLASSFRGAYRVGRPLAVSHMYRKPAFSMKGLYRAIMATVSTAALGTRMSGTQRSRSQVNMMFRASWPRPSER